MNSALVLGKLLREYRGRTNEITPAVVMNHTDVQGDKTLAAAILKELRKFLADGNDPEVVTETPTKKEKGNVKKDEKTVLALAYGDINKESFETTLEGATAEQIESACAKIAKAKPDTVPDRQARLDLLTLTLESITDEPDSDADVDTDADTVTDETDEPFPGDETPDPEETDYSGFTTQEMRALWSGASASERDAMKLEMDSRKNGNGKTPTPTATPTPEPTPEPEKKTNGNSEKPTNGLSYRASFLVEKKVGSPRFLKGLHEGSKNDLAVALAHLDPKKDAEKIRTITAELTRKNGNGKTTPAPTVTPEEKKAILQRITSQNGKTEKVEPSIDADHKHGPVKSITPPTVTPTVTQTPTSTPTSTVTLTLTVSLAQAKAILAILG